MVNIIIEVYPSPHRTLFIRFKDYILRGYVPYLVTRVPWKYLSRKRGPVLTNVSNFAKIPGTQSMISLISLPGIASAVYVHLVKLQSMMCRTVADWPQRPTSEGFMGSFTRVEAILPSRPMLIDVRIQEGQWEHHYHVRPATITATRGIPCCSHRVLYLHRTNINQW